MRLRGIPSKAVLLVHNHTLALLEKWLSCLPHVQIPDSDSSCCEEDAFVSALNDCQKQLTVQCTQNGATHLLNVAHMIHQLMDAFPMEHTGKCRK